MSIFDRHSIFLYQNVLLYSIAFFIPVYPSVISLLIIAFGALSIYAIIRGFSRAQLSQVSILFLILFGLHLIGMLYTENVERGLFDLEVKLSLFAFPVAFVGYKYLTRANFRRTLQMFMYGTVIEAILCLAQSSYQYFILDKPYYYFLTSRFSFMLHPSYFAIYLTFSILILAFLEWPFFHKENKLRSAYNLLLLVFLSISLLLTASKIGFIIWMVIMISITILLVKEVRSKWVPIMGLMILSSIMGFIFQSSPMLQKRIMYVVRIAQGTDVNSSASESTAARTLVYSAAWELVTTQPWYGQGTGDFQDALDGVYEENQFTFPLERHLNAHNQFLQAWIALGIPGLITVIGVFIVMIMEASKSKTYLYSGFIAIMVLISLTESMLNVQAGIIFFTFFGILFSRRALAYSGD